MKNIRYAVLGAALLVISSAPLAFANNVDPISDGNPPTDSRPFSVFCAPYTTPFVSGGYYIPQEGNYTGGGVCTYSLPALTTTYRVLQVYKGTVGSSTLIDDGHTLSPNTLLTTSPNNFLGSQGDDFFFAAYGVNSGTDLTATENTLTGVPGAQLPAGVTLNLLPWKWGVKPTSPLTVTADNKTIELGSTIPALTATLSGFVAPDTAASNDVTGSASCSTTATASSVPGNYPITCTVGGLISAANYSFITFVPGTLTIVDTTAPTVIVTAPVNGQNYLTNASIIPAATIKDLSPIAAVVYKFNGTVVSTSSPLTLPQVTATTSEALVVSATDSFGNTGYGTSTFLLAPVPPAPVTDHTAPTIVITSPVNNGLYAKTDTTVHVTATVTDQSAIATTTYWFNGVKINPANALPLANAPVVSKVSVASSDIYSNAATSTVTIYVVKSVNSCLIDIVSVLTAIAQDKTLPSKPTILNLIADCSALLKGLHRYDLH